jgi:uncharacterized protein (TIGR02271 family)
MSTSNTPHTTLVAAFNSDTNAQAAIQELERAGVRSDQIHIHSNRETGGTKQNVHEGGFTGWIKNLFGAEDEDRAYYDRAYQSGNTIVAVDTTEDRIESLAERLDQFHPVELQESQGSTAGTKTGTGKNESSAIPVVDENLAVGKRTYQRGGVRVYSHVVETPVQENVKLRDEQAYVTRTPVDRPAASGDIRSGEQAVEVKEFSEEPVVEKRARVVEEVKVGKNVSERTETVRDTVRHTEVDVQPLGEGDTSSQSSATTPADSEFRRHFAQNYASAGSRYEDYGPAYAYGYTSAGDPQYRNRPFNEVESDLRASYERRYPNSSWEKIKNSVRYGWDRMTGKA